MVKAVGQIELVLSFLASVLFFGERITARELAGMGLLCGSILLVFTYQTPIVGWLVLLMSMAVIGVHGMLSGTASMDFGGSKNAGIAVGLIDGFVYLGTAAMSFS